jgi:hypothetical protein
MRICGPGRDRGVTVIAQALGFLFPWPAIEVVLVRGGGRLHLPFVVDRRHVVGTK